ncbi:MAG TPA: hypothetical protein VJH55_02730 [Candidatus Paceibacterota bacterium]
MSFTPLQWTAFEYHHHPKSPDWYWAVGIISVSAAAAAIVFNNFLFAIFIILSATSLCLFAAKKPSLLSCELNERGILIDNTLYLYNSIESFWVDTLHHSPKIYLKSKKLLLPYIIVPIDEIDPRIVQKYLTHHLTEEEHKEALSQKIMEHLGF